MPDRMVPRRNQVPVTNEQLRQLNARYKSKDDLFDYMDRIMVSTRLAFA